MVHRRRNDAGLGGRGLTVMGWDLGGANLKACLLRKAGGRVLIEGSWHLPCELWRGLDRLSDATRTVLTRVNSSFAADAHAVTMTGELVDLFATRKQGVQQIARTVGAQINSNPSSASYDPRYGVAFYAMPGCFVANDSLGRHADAVMSANWHAAAYWLSKQLSDGLLLDVGSTTTDLIAWRDDKLRLAGTTDHARLASSELVYTGASRTPVMAVARQVGFGGVQVGIAAEHFATMADVYRLLGQRSPGAMHQPTADGGPATAQASAIRLARMVGLDASQRPVAHWRALARTLANEQCAQLVSAVERVAGHAGLPADAPIVVAGSGEFIARQVAARARRRCIRIESFVAGSGGATKRKNTRGLSTLASVAPVVPAYAVAWHAIESISRSLNER